MTLEHRAADAVVWLALVLSLLLAGVCTHHEPTPLPAAVPSKAP